MIVWVSAALMSYELWATARHRPTVTVLSHRWPYGFFIWGWLAWLAVHLLSEALTIPKGARL